MKICKNCKQYGFIQLFKGYCTDCFYKCAICEKCQKWHQMTQDDFLHVSTRGEIYREPFEHFEISLEKIGTVKALKLLCPDCDMSFRHSFGWSDECLKRDEGVDEGVVIIVSETE